MNYWVFLLGGLVGALVGGATYFAAMPWPHDVFARVEAIEPDQRIWFNQHATEVFPARTVSRSERALDMEIDPEALDGFTFSYQGRQYEISDMFLEMETSGLVILHRGKIVFEKYSNGAGPGTLFTTYSVVKSITGSLVGAAIADGLIDSVDDQLVKYLPELMGTAYDGVTIRQTLQMSSGVRFDPEQWRNPSDTYNFLENSLFLGTNSAYEIAISHPRERAPGSLFNYSTAESQVVLEIVRRVSGLSASAYLEKTIWRPLGMSHDAAWILDYPGPTGVEIGGGFFNASLRDWARFGQLIAQDGKWNGESILPEGWVEQATAKTEPHLSPGELHPDPKRGYGMHWWTYDDGTFLASGGFGQAIYIDPENEIVVARASAWPVNWVEAYDNWNFAMFKAIAEKVAK